MPYCYPPDPRIHADRNLRRRPKPATPAFMCSVRRKNFLSSRRTSTRRPQRRSRTIRNARRDRQRARPGDAAECARPRQFGDPSMRSQMPPADFVAWAARAAFQLRWVQMRENFSGTESLELVANSYSACVNTLDILLPSPRASCGRTTARTRDA